MAVKSKTFLRRAEREDLDTVVGWMEDPDFTQFLYGDPARSPRQIRETIVQMLGRSAGQTVPGAIYLVIDSEEYGPIGMLSLQNISWRNRACTLDLYIGQKHLRNRLVAAIAFVRAMEYCFEELNLHRVGAFIYAFNERSWRIFEKSGAVRELVLPKHVARDGQLHDVYGYGLLRSEFEAFKAKHARSIENLMSSMVDDHRSSEPAPENLS
ncbi:MAG TPA: GNAT family protein [Candidatus Hydrogenedentes bacterium]|nr:GNAT family protein [Candidatus Hydrogenedentota bacterium]HRT20320.1 GNAT family protein [Candidatus Hydrogenedentota bacterium]HRT65046.1 GNAT family protein [Candidatus Hydrogenedentota bacterium]